jgi:pimeloyl-ACP methyl ester carboxylesterase
MIHLPIILIHGFNGSPSNWIGPGDRFPEFLTEHGYDPDLIRVFDYGSYKYDGKLRYNNLGDMREIAHRLDDPDSIDPAVKVAAVDRLSEESRARGGPSKVTIIAHSSGGLVARYYLTRQTEDEFHTRYRGNVGQVIFLGTPHLGVDVEDLLDPFLSGRLIYGLMVRVHYLLPPEYHGHAKSLRDSFGQMRRITKTAFFPESTEENQGETPAFKQMHPGSDFLRDINSLGGMPEDVGYSNIIGDVRAGVRIRALGRDIVDHEKSFGDFLVSVASAGAIPNAPSDCYALVEEHCLEVDLTRRISRLVRLMESGEHPTPLHRWLRSLPASREHILEILARSHGPVTNVARALPRTTETRQEEHSEPGRSPP